MCVIVPFRAVRPPKELVKDVASYPYDIIDSEEARILTKNNPISFLHVVKSEIDLPSHIDIHDDRNAVRVARRVVAQHDERGAAAVVSRAFIDVGHRGRGGGGGGAGGRGGAGRGRR